jgi:hypothetical protein
MPSWIFSAAFAETSPLSRVTLAQKHHLGEDGGWQPSVGPSGRPVGQPQTAGAGTIAARLLVEFGVDPEKAIRENRMPRVGSIETREQEEYVRKQKVWRRSPAWT